MAYDPSILFQATGDRGDAFTVSNRSRSRCRVDGYPQLTLRDRMGAIVPFRYTNGHSQYVTQRPPEPVTLEPGASAYVAVAKYRCDMGGTVLATTLDMLLPGQHVPVSVALSGRASNLTYCNGGPDDPGNTIAISPIEPTSSQLQQ